MIPAPCTRRGVARTFAAGLALLALMALEFATGLRPAAAGLVLTNGDFTNFTGLVVQSSDWYNGVPTGWSTANSSGVGSPGFSVYVGSSGTQSIANLSQLGSLSGGFRPLYQYLGTTDSTGTVTVSFETLDPWNPSSINVGAALYAGVDPSGGLLNNASYTTTGVQTLQATGVAAGTQVTIAFWNAGGTSGIDSVIVVPEPAMTGLLVIACVGMAACRELRRRTAVA